MPRAYLPKRSVRRPASRVQCPASRVQRTESSVLSPASRVQRPKSRVQRPESSIQRPASRVQRPTLASRVQEFRYAPIKLILAISRGLNRKEMYLWMKLYCLMPPLNAFYKMSAFPDFLFCLHLNKITLV